MLNEASDRNRSLAVVLVSGGLDSCVTAAIANADHALALLHVSYGQRTEARELRAFNDIADFFCAEKRLVVSLDHLRQIGGSSLTDPTIAVPDADLGRSAIPTTYVPFRNAHLLCIAVSWAEVIGAGHVYIGAAQPDSSGYPDCRPEFYDAFGKAIDLGTKPETTISMVTPLINQTKKEIVQKGVSLGAPLQLTWSCYRNEDVACGTCDSCTLRLRGFDQAGIQDPLPYPSNRLHEDRA